MRQLKQFVTGLCWYCWHLWREFTKYCLLCEDNLLTQRPTLHTPSLLLLTPRSVLCLLIQSNMPITSVTNRSRKPTRLNTSKPFSHFCWKKNTKFCYKTLRRAKVNTPWREIITRTGNIVLRSCWTVGWRLGFRQAPDAHSNALT